jgi:hypothetical protein
VVSANWALKLDEHTLRSLSSLVQEAILSGSRILPEHSQVLTADTYVADVCVVRETPLFQGTDGRFTAISAETSHSDMSGNILGLVQLDQEFEAPNNINLIAVFLCGYRTGVHFFDAYWMLGEKVGPTSRRVGLIERQKPLEEWRPWEQIPIKAVLRMQKIDIH